MQVTLFDAMPLIASVFIMVVVISTGLICQHITEHREVNKMKKTARPA
jgi:hypothetical protein